MFIIDDYLKKVVNNIPSSVKDLHIWLCYDDRDKPSYTQYDAKKINNLKKQPRDLKGIPLKNWTKRCFTFNECIDSIKKGYTSGLGVVVDNDLIGLDLDDCIKIKKIDKLGLEIPLLSDDVAELIDKLNDSYIEISQSGKGLHCLVYSSVAIPKTTKKGGFNLEIYAKKSHFLRLSGNTINNYGADVEILDKTDVMLDIYNKYFDIEDNNQQQVNDIVFKDSNISFRDDEYREQFNGLTNKYTEQEILDNLFKIGGSFYKKLYNNELTQKDIDKYNSNRKGRGLKDTSNSGLSVLLILNLMYYSYGDDDIVYNLFRKSKLYKKEYERIVWRAKNLSKLDMIYNYCKSRFINFKKDVDLLNE